MFQRSLKALAVPWVRVRSCRELRDRNKVRRNEVKQYLVRANLPAGLLFDQPRLGPVPPWGTGRMVTVQEELSDGKVIRNTFDVASVEFGHLGVSRGVETCESLSRDVHGPVISKPCASCGVLRC